MRTEVLIKRNYSVITFLFRILNMSIAILGSTPSINFFFMYLSEEAQLTLCYLSKHSLIVPLVALLGG